VDKLPEIPFGDQVTFYVTGDIDLNNCTLTILPGTSVWLSDSVKIYVPGSSKIIANGDAIDKISFDAYDNHWDHIDINSSTGNEFDHCIFRHGVNLANNTTQRGGAIEIVLSEASVTNCIFTDNLAYDGGAIATYQSNVLIEDCTFFRNRATHRGGAIHIREVTTPEVNTTINRCIIYSNRALETGGIHVANNTNALIMNSLIYSNTSSIDGGITTNTFNDSPLGDVNIVNCVVANNTPHDVFFRGSLRSKALNCIIWGSDQSVGYRTDSNDTLFQPRAFNLENCAVQGASRFSPIDISFYTNCIKLNSSNSAPDGPNFVNPLTDYSILAVSPCKDQGISTGVPTTDILGYTRTAPYDIGAYEVQRQFISWTGAINNNWMNSDNWSPASIPGNSDDVRIPDVGNSPIISSGTGLSYNLIIESPAELTVETGGSLNAAGSVFINSSSTTNSGSVINQGTVTGTVVYNRTIPDDGTTQMWHYISSPVVTDSVVSAKEFYPWNEVAGDWGSPVSGLSGGIGYTVIGGGSVSFIGSLQSSNFSVDATSPYNDVLSGTNYSGRTYVQGDGHSGTIRSYTNYGGGGFNLLGNPFASALKITDSDGISGNDFISANPGQFDPNYVAVYIYNGNSYGYIGNSTGWTTNNPSHLSGTDHVQVGQAFFVLAMNDYTTFSFNKEMQVHNTTVQLLKSTSSDNKWPGIQLKVRSAEKEASTLIVYDLGMSVGLDPGYDVGFMSGGAEIEIYSALAADTRSVNYARQALPLTDIDSVIVPIGIDTRTGGEITFSAEAITFKSYRYLLEDRQKGIFVDISKRNYKTTVAPESFGTGRFFLHTAYADRRNKQPGFTNDASSEVRIWAYGNDVIIKGPLSAGARCEIFTLQGQIVLSAILREEELNTISTTLHLKGTYLVRVTDGIKVHTAKIFIR
jgi:predicted outer membrane repeat protein